MKTLTMTLIALLAASAATAKPASLNADRRLDGRFAQESAIRLFGPKDMCADEANAEYSEEEQACYYFGEGNTITISGNDVEVQVIYGAANERSFAGRIVKIGKNVIEARETEVHGPQEKIRFVKNGCVMLIRLGNGTASSIPGENCDGRLAIEGARKKGN